LNLLPRSDIHGVHSWLCSGAGRPGVADETAKAAAPRILHQQYGIDGLPQPCRSVTRPCEGQPPRACGKGDIGCDGDDEQAKQDCEGHGRPR
jgi:hypothetical protein